MFTGIIEALGEIEKIQSSKLFINTPFSEKTKIGQSIAINGCCLTIAEKIGETLRFDILNTTLETTNFNTLKQKDLVNLERAIPANGRIEGHFLQGHIDTTSQIITFKKIDNSYHLEIIIPDSIAPYCVEKGSLAIDGISLTIAKLQKKQKKLIATFGIIPTTYQKTRLHKLKAGDILNLEADILAKYIKGKT